MKVVVYTKTHCPYCDRAKALLKSKGQKYEEINLDNDQKQFSDLMAKTGMKTVPQIFINDKCVGGFQELSALDRSGALSDILQTQ